VIAINAFGCQKPQPLKVGDTLLHPEPIGADEGTLKETREKWIALTHSAAPGVDWKKVEFSNAEIMRSIKASLVKKGGIISNEVFAGSKLQGTWSEKGPINQAGSIIGVDYDSIANNLYVISSGGTLWRNNGLAANNWTLLNDDYSFTNNIIKVINKAGGGRRIIAGLNQTLYYSDNEGSTFTPCSGISYPVSWGSNNVVQVEAIKGATNDIIAMVYAWDPTPWAARLSLYRSTDDGMSFTKIWTLNHGESGRAKMTLPYNSNNVYVFDGQSSPGFWTISKLTGSTLSLLNSIPQPELANSVSFRGTQVGGFHFFYAINNNSKIYRTDSYGASWGMMSNLPENAWERVDVSMNDPAKVFNGGVNAFRSFDNGVNWTKVNNWSEYYSNVNSKLHADMMQIVQFRKTDGTPFCIINNHGGVAISYDDLVTTQNLSIQGLPSAQFYDILTAPDNYNYVYAGSQDQGFQRTTNALSAGSQLFSQLISGDYGYLTMASSNKIMYAQYPGGALYIYGHPGGNYIKNYTLPGSTKPNYGWMLPMENYYSDNSDTVLMAGGNLTGGSGSYLCKIAMQPISPFAIYTTQYNYDFRANSTTGTAGITAIEAPSLQRNKLYVALENGNFFYSDNYGQTWTRTSNFGPVTPWYLYGSTIVASKITPDLVWFGGSGYSNPGIYKSTNGGASFTPINNGMPSTLIHEIVTNLAETMIFAATDAGPYVYIVAENKWYPMTGANTPVQSFVSVEFLPNTNTVRFGTFGRGIWDFTLSTPPLYVFTGNGNWDNAANWSYGIIPPAILPAGAEIYINPPAGAACILNVSQQINTGARFAVAPGKSIKLNNNLTMH
jgi:hypothetical protein